MFYLTVSDSDIVRHTKYVESANDFAADNNEPTDLTNQDIRILSGVQQENITIKDIGRIHVYYDEGQWCIQYNTAFLDTDGNWWLHESVIGWN